MSSPLRTTHLISAFLIAALAPALWFLLSDPALAQTGGTANDDFRCIGGRASGALYSSNASCPASLTFSNVFSFLICNMEQISSDLMGNMYCGTVRSLTPMFMGALTLAVFFFGVGFTIGVIPATAREFQKFLIKIAFIFAFATQAEYLVGYGYRFLVEGAREGIAVAMSGLYDRPGVTNTTSGAAVYGQLDRFLSRTIHFATDYIGAKWDGDPQSNPCRNAIFAVLAIMAVAFPPIFFLALLIIVKIAVTFLRAVFGYVVAIVGIAFLLTLAPLFLSFFLFQQTRAYFDKWLGYLVSFALQMVIIFAFLTFVVSIDVSNLSKSIVNIIIPVEETQETTALRLPWKYCTLCQFEVVMRDANGVETVVAQNRADQFIGEGELRCTQPVQPIRALSAVAPEDGKAPDRSIQNSLLRFVGSALLSLLVLAYIIDSILRYIPYLAQKLAGGMAQWAPQLGGGSSPSGVATVDFPGLSPANTRTGDPGGVFSTFERGFNRGFSNPGRDAGSDSISRTFAGVQQGFTNMVSGTEGSSLDPGLGKRFINYMMSPLPDSRD